MIGHVDRVRQGYASLDRGEPPCGVLRVPAHDGWVGFGGKAEDERQGEGWH